MMIPIEVRTEGGLSPGLILQRVEAKPTHISVLVPRRYAGTDLQIPTEPLDLRKVTATTTHTLRLIPPPDTYFESGKPATVVVTIRVRPNAPGRGGPAAQEADQLK